MKKKPPKTNEPAIAGSLLLSVRASKIIIHKSQVSKDITAYFFTKSKNKCLRVEYNSYWDFGKSPSGARLDHIEIHYQNSWVKDNLTEIKIEDVPECIIDVLRYLA